MKRFNTSGPNIPTEHYTLLRSNFIEDGLVLVNENRYFTIWAPRQTGKSTYFRQLAGSLKGEGYEVAHINVENYKDASVTSFLNYFRDKLSDYWNIDVVGDEIADFFQQIEKIKDRKFVLIIDEVEGINPAYFGTFLHSIRNAYHSREEHSLKSVILVGVTNIVGIVADNASPFNIAENMNIAYFTKEETMTLLNMHEVETGQLFAPKTKEKIYEITAGQPGLVNGFAYQLVTRYKEEKVLTYEHYLEVEEWYLTEAIDKNVSNIINKAKEFRGILETLLFTEKKIPFEINREPIKVLHTNGIIKKGADKNVEFWVPLYRKSLYSAFYPYTNGEGGRIGGEVLSSHYFNSEGKLNFDVLIQNFKKYIQRRGFVAFRERPEKSGDTEKDLYKPIPEAVMIYAFETFIQAVLNALEGKSYREAQAASGRTDLIVYVGGEELMFETKVFYNESLFKNGKKQLAYYCKHLGLSKGIYLVFMPEHLLKLHKENIFETQETIDGIEIYTYLVEYEDETPEYRKPKKKK